LRLADLDREFGNDVSGEGAIAGTEISGLTSDSRGVEPGFLFAALPGTHADGRAFIADAVRRGAAAVLAPADLSAAEVAGTAVPVILDANPRRRFAEMAARFYGRQPATVVAVTGTNGKTSVVSFLRQIWEHAGRPAASLGTLGVESRDIRRVGALTTPDPVALHAVLAQLATAGVDSLAMEASSHGLDQHRLDGVRIAAAVFTNLGRDHLDYHGSMEAYAAAKRRLFMELVADDGVAVLNADDRAFPEFVAAVRGRPLRLVTYGRAGVDVRLEGVRPLPDGQVLRLGIAGRNHDVPLPLVGEFQAMNALCAAATALATGCAEATVIEALHTLTGVPGRMQRVAVLASGGAVFVDYAHTPDALAAALAAVRPHARGRVTLVFGCGGDRDRGKRRVMGEVAAASADRIVVTDDNPRGEDPAAIRRQVLTGCPGAEDIADRRHAIAAAVDGLAAGDVLVIAGKGHETGQIVGDRVLPFDDAEAARAAVAAREGRS
jgi:UDP-N-acetylmuramoyl-L-alanyl-D-glutamate--2,6-diaminopimelate ligase